MGFSRRSLLLLAVLATTCMALQVSPNSPCASFCLDSNHGDKSDPNASNTDGKDMACTDEEFGNTPEGQKFQQCVSCLQDSTFAGSGESDMQWFLYNMRYSFDYCVFAYPNATDVDSNPCVTSEACGPLAENLKDGILDPSLSSEYDYCGEDNGAAMLGESEDNCFACVQSTGTHAYISNFLTALRAGCEQQPASGVLLGLNETVFSKTAIEIVDPTAVLDEASKDSNAGFTTAAIVGVAIGGFVFLLLLAGCIYIQYRKRKNRVARASRARSSMSFVCQTHLTPRTPEFRSDDDAASMEEKPYMDPSAALSSNPVSGHGSFARESHSKLSSLTTTIPRPPPIHASPQRGSPTSTISVRSNAPLLNEQSHHSQKHYYASSTPPVPSSDSFVPGLAVSTPSLGASPYMGQSGFNQTRESPNSQWAEVSQASTRNLMKKKGPVVGGRPVEMRHIQTSFPPPPKR